MFKSVVVSFSIAASALSAQAAPEVQLTSSLTSVSAGQVFDVLLKGLSFDQTAAGLVIDNLSGAQNFNFTFANLEVVNVAIDPRWTFGNNVGTINQTMGTWTGLRFGTFPSTTDDNFNIATITLKALAAGPAVLDLVSGSFSGKVGGVAGQKFNPAMGEISVTAVLEPQQWALLLAGLGFIGMRLKRG